MGILAVVIGIPLNWMYYIFWHMLFEKKKMQSDEMKWLQDDLNNTDENIHHYSNLIWHYIDINRKNNRFADWLRSNFLLIHSLGSSIGAIILGLIFYKSANPFVNISLPQGKKFIIWIFWILWLDFLLLIIIYRLDLKKRYMKRLEIFIKENSKKILNHSFN